MTRFTHSKPIGLAERPLRALAFLQSGQRCICWLPLGDYEIGEVVKIPRGRDDPALIDARRLIRTTGVVYHVSEALFQDELRRQGAQA